MGTTAPLGTVANCQRPSHAVVGSQSCKDGGSPSWCTMGTVGEHMGREGCCSGM
jgi:hypothetical protein